MSKNKFLVRRHVRNMAVGPVEEVVSSDRYNYYVRMINRVDKILYVLPKKSAVKIPYTAIHVTDVQMQVIENSRGISTVILNDSKELTKFAIEFRCGMHPVQQDILKVYTNKKYTFIRVIYIREKTLSHWYDGIGNVHFKWAFTVKFELV